jgi:hypothetical protein
VNIKNSSWSGPPSLSERYGMALCRLDRRHQQSGGVKIINSSWMGSQSRLGQWASKAQCHLSPALSASQQGTGRCLRTATGVGRKRLIMVKRLDVAWVLGRTGAMDIVGGVDPRDQKDEKDQRLRLDHGQRLAWAAAFIGAFQGRIAGCELPTGLGITRLSTLNHAWSGLVTLNSGVFFWCFHTGVFAHGSRCAKHRAARDRHYADCHHGACARPPGDRHWSEGWKKPGHAFAPLGIVPQVGPRGAGNPSDWNGLERLGRGFLGPICFSGYVCTRPPCGRVPLRNTKSCVGQGHYYGEVWGLLILLPHKRDREARAILRMPPLAAACRRVFRHVFFGAWRWHRAATVEDLQTSRAAHLGRKRAAHHSPFIAVHRPASGTAQRGPSFGCHHLFRVCLFLWRLRPCLQTATLGTGTDGHGRGERRVGEHGLQRRSRTRRITWTQRT